MNYTPNTASGKGAIFNFTITVLIASLCAVFMIFIATLVPGSSREQDTGREMRDPRRDTTRIIIIDSMGRRRLK